MSERNEILVRSRHCHCALDQRETLGTLALLHLGHSETADSRIEIRQSPYNRFEECLGVRELVFVVCNRGATERIDERCVQRGELLLDRNLTRGIAAVARGRCDADGTQYNET